jgi:sarcosine oxidase subunit gamma
MIPMESAWMRESRPLWALSANGIAITETAPAICILRVRAPDAPLVEALGRALATPWPSDPNTVADGLPLVAWLAPGEWAVFAPADQIRTDIETVCKDRLHHLVDVSAGRRLWRIQGLESRALIAKGCSLDLHPETLGPGRCAQSLMAAVPALLIPQEGNQAFDLVADASFAGHLRAWFTDAAREFLA